MTVRSDLKKRIRARQAKTGESYTAARMKVLRAAGRAESETLGTRLAVVLKGTGQGKLPHSSMTQCIPMACSYSS